MRLSVKPVFVVLSLGLASCASQAVAPDSAGPRTGGTPPPVPLPDGKPGEVAVVPPPPTPRPLSEGAVSAEPSTPATDAAKLTPSEPVRSFPELVGMSDGEVRTAMGAPDRISDRPPARVWRYELSGCSLDLFLFPDVSSGATKALTWSALPTEPQAAEAVDPRCAEVSADG